MVASVRSIAATSLRLVASGTAARGEVQPGDLMLAWHSCDEGSTLNMSIGGGWTPLVTKSGIGWTGTRIWKRVAGEGEPATYPVEQGDADAAGTVIILAIRQGDTANIAITSADGQVAPAATPSTPAGLEIRYAAGEAVGACSWATQPGYSGLDIQAGSFTTATIAVRTFLSTSPLSALDMRPSLSNINPHAFTILVGSTDSGGQPPTPPSFPAFTPGKGESRLRYTVHDFLTGAYRGDISPSGVTLDKRIGEPGTWRGRLSIANDDEGAKIAEIFPADPADLLSGPGMLVVHTWRSGVLWGIHWLHTTLTSQDGRSAITMDLQGSTLDGYLLHVSLEEDLTFGGDQIQNARDLILHMQATPASSAGLSLMPGVSGVARPLVAAVKDNTTYGRILQEYARASEGFESVVNARVEDGVIIRSWEWGSPKIVGDGVHVFTQGEAGGDITGWREERSALRGGTRWGVIGGTPQQTDATAAATAVRSELVATPHVAAGWPIIDRRLTHPGNSTNQTTIDDYATYWASRAPGAPSVFSFDAVIGTGATLGPNSLGDQVRAILNNPRYPINADGSASFNRSQRLIGWELTPADRGQGGKDKIKLITEEAA
jgi:hypothetical protein